MWSIHACLLACALLKATEAHAWLQQPPGRSSAWRFGFRTPVNYNDNELNCGGYQAQHFTFDGKCGMCGDPYGGRRAHEPGPDNVYANGVIVSSYTQGQSIVVKVKITASHKGYHEFRLCKNDVPQAGLAKSTAALCDAESTSFPRLQSPDGRTRFDEMDPAIVLQLPEDVVCKACILQWRWKTGNRWGCDAEGCGLGHGPQEEFYGCADIRIVPSLGSTYSPPTALRNATVTISNEQSPANVGQPFRTSTAAATASKAPATEAPVQGSDTSSAQPTTGLLRLTCNAVPPYGTEISLWCNVVCNWARSYCPASHCQCDKTQR